MKFYLSSTDIANNWHKMDTREGFHFREIEIPIDFVTIEKSKESKLFVERFKKAVLKEVGAASTHISDSSSFYDTTPDIKLKAKLAILCKPPCFEKENTFMQFQDAGVIQAIEGAAVSQGLSLSVRVAVKNLLIKQQRADILNRVHISSTGSILDYTKNYGSSGGCNVTFDHRESDTSLWTSAESYFCNISCILVTCDVAYENPKPVNIPETILDKEILTDAIIKTSDGESVKCHRVFLAAQSSVFRRMFENGMKETKTGVIEIPDLSVEGARALLRYLYLLCVTKPTEKFEIAVELLKAGHKYDIEPLEKQMANIILGQPETWLDLETSITLFKFIRNLEGYECVNLKLVTFMKKNAGELMNSPQYTALFDEDKAAAMELCSRSFSL